MRPVLFAVLLATLTASTAGATPQQDATACTSEKTQPDAAIAACTRLLGSRAIKGGQVATIHFWRGVHYNRKGDYTRVIADMTESLRITPGAVAVLNMRGSAYFDKGEYDIAIADFNDAIRIGPPHTTLFHNRGNAWRGKGDYARAIADYSEAIKLSPKDAAFSYQNRGVSKQALGDLDGALADINESIRANPQLPSTYMTRGTLWRAKGDFNRAIADSDEAIRLAKSGVPALTLTPLNSWLINSYVHRGLAYETKGDYSRAKDDFNAALALAAADAGSKASQATAKARLTVLANIDQVPTLPRAPDGGARRQIALVIGNGAYVGASPLPNPPNDARAVAKSLRDIGFEVTEGIDLDRAKMESAIREFMRNAVTARTAVVFYAGHGMQVDGKNFLLPVDAKTDGNLASSITDVDTLLAGLDEQVRTNIIILDACRDNPLAQKVVAQAGASRSVSVRSGLAAPSAPLGAGSTLGAGTLIAFATAPGQVALDGDGANSPFSTALLRHMGTPGLEVQQMLTRVRAEVVAATKNKQVPWSNSSLLGEVFLVGGR